MADFLPDLRPVAAVLLLAGAPLALDAASPRSAPRSAPGDRALTIDANSWVVDYNSNHLVMKDVTIAQGGISIRAGEAEANSPEMSFDGSRWMFRGDVRIRFEDGMLQSDTANVSFVGNRISRAEVNGAPAEFEQKLDKRPMPARGRAGRIDYDVNAGRMTLSEGIWLTDGRGEYRSDSQPLVYNVRERRLQSGGDAQAPAAPTSGGRIQITIQPDEDEPAEQPPQ